MIRTSAGDRGNRTLQSAHTRLTRGVDPRSQRPAKPARKEDDMLSRRTILGAVAVLGVGLITAAVSAGRP